MVLKMNKFVVSICMVILIALTGCASNQHAGPLPNDPFYAPVIPDLPRQKLAEDGSIFQSEMANSIYSDVKARRIGDIITVTLRENTSATKSAGTTTSRESGASIDPLLGLGGNVVNIGGQGIQLDLQSESEFSGDAQANQSNNLSGNISVTVIQVLSNQNLVVRGEKWITLNNGDEYIRVSGIVRPRDISSDNIVQSDRIANADINYIGAGDTARSGKKGWYTKMIETITPL